jgi:hypothetical protein
MLGSRNEESSDIYEDYKENVNTYLSEVTKTTSSYIQAVSDLQMDMIRSWRNTIDSIIGLQENFSNKSGTKYTFSDLEVKMVMDVLSEQINKTQEMQNKMLLASIDAIGQNTKSFNNNIKAFDEFRSRIIEFFISSAMLPKVDPKAMKKAISEFKEIKSIETKRLENQKSDHWSKYK